MKKSNLSIIAAILLMSSCAKSGIKNGAVPLETKDKITADAVSPVGDVVGKLVVGYQGWFACAGDGSPRNSWVHWAGSLPNAVPPVCRIIDYSKFVYEQKKKQKEIKANAKQTVIKEIRFGPNTNDHDFQFKLKHAQSFLESGEKVRAYVHFKGRAIVYKEQGEILLLKFAQALEDIGKVELLPKLEGKRMFLTLAPKVVKK